VTGEDVFDCSVWVEGDEGLVLAVLNSPNRAAVLALVRGQLTRRGRSSVCATGRFDEGGLNLDLPEELPPDDDMFSSDGSNVGRTDALYLGGRLDHLPEAIAAAVDLARRLAAPADIGGCLLENFRSEPEAGVRRRLLEILVTRFPSHAAARALVRLALEDVDADVRADAAALAGPRARPVLMGVACGEGASDATSARAVATLALSLTAVEVNEILRNALRLRKLETARACLRVLGSRGGPEAVKMLARVLSVERDVVGNWAAESLGATGDRAAEPILLEHLSAREKDRRIAVTRALGRTGTVAAVPALRALEDTDAGLRRVAREAIALIQSRRAGAQPGQLSLAEDAAGRLSLSGEGGELSFPSSTAVDRRWVR
jgi:HEAT repeat protein